MNEIQLPIVGNVTAAPELRFTATGIAVVSFTVAHNPRFFDKTASEWKDGTPTFFDCRAWRDLAEHIAESIPSGSRVILVGNLRTNEWKSDGRGKVPEGETIRRQRIDVLALGAELTYATAAIKKATRTRAGEVAPDDPWATASRERPTAPAAASSFDDEPPF